jgi:hypothetical protein
LLENNDKKRSLHTFSAGETIIGHGSQTRCQIKMLRQVGREMEGQEAASGVPTQHFIHANQCSAHRQVNPSFALGNLPEFFSNIFHLWLVESTYAELMDAKG